MRKENPFRIAFYTSLLTFLIILPAFSQQRWERNYGGAGNDRGYSVQQTTDGGYIVAGTTTSFGSSYQIYLIKTNASGDTLWTRTYGGRRTDYANSVQQTSDAGYIIAGYSASFRDSLYTDFYLIKTNASGDTLWTRTYGGTIAEEAYSVQQTSDGGYIIVGRTDSYGAGDWDVYVVKTNSSGDTIWTKTYGTNQADGGHSIQQTSDHGYILTGFSGFYHIGNNDVYIIKTDSLGFPSWARGYGGLNDDEGQSVQQTSDGGYIIAGFTGSFGAGPHDVYLIKTNAFGDTLWIRTYGGTSADYGSSVHQTSDGGYIVAGETCSFSDSLGDVYLIKTNASGDTLWTRSYGGAGNDEGWSVQQTQDGGYIVAGYTNSFGNGNQVYLIKTDANGSSGVEEVRNAELGMRNAILRITPNPFTSFTTLHGHSSERFSLYDISGRKVGTYKGDRIGEGLSPGVYFLRSSDSKDKHLRIVKVR